MPYQKREAFSSLVLPNDIEAVPYAITAMQRAYFSADQYYSGTMPVLDLLAYAYVRKSLMDAHGYRSLLFFFERLLRGWEYTLIYAGIPESGPDSLHLCWNSAVEYPFCFRCVVMLDDTVPVDQPRVFVEPSTYMLP